MTQFSGVLGYLFIELIWYGWVTLGRFDASHHQNRTTITYSRVVATTLLGASDNLAKTGSGYVMMVMEGGMWLSSSKKYYSKCYHEAIYWASRPRCGNKHHGRAFRIWRKH
jgi:hypothetical protein